MFKVKHKLDGTQYAVKKIPIRSEGINAVRNYLTEVKTFASLNHSNIVQYKAAWLELGVATSKNAISGHQNESESSSMFESSYNSNYKKTDSYIYPEMITKEETTLYRTKNLENTDFEISFVSSNGKDNNLHSYSTEYDFPKKIKREKRSSTSEGGNAICTFEEIEQIRVQVQHHPKWATLYIQMSLCQLTLKQWLEKRNAKASVAPDGDKTLIPLRNTVRYDTVMEILKQLLKGTFYLCPRKYLLNSLLL